MEDNKDNKKELTIPQELIILKCILCINAYNKYIAYIDLNALKEYNMHIYALYAYLGQLHNKYNKDLSVDEFQALFTSQSGEVGPRNKEYYETAFAQLRAISVSEEVAGQLLQSLKERMVTYQLAQKAFDVSEGRGSLEDLLGWIGSNTEEARTNKTTALQFVSDDLDQLLDGVAFSEGLEWRLNCLNTSLGPLRKGDFGFLFARPETGKTTFLASEVTHMATQTKGDILWFNNEEQGDKVKIRTIQAALGVTLEQLNATRKKYKEAYESQFEHRIKLIDNARLHYRDVEAACKSTKPALIIFDQIDKIIGFNSDREDLRLGTIYQWARELAKTYAPTIGVCQADGTGEGVKWLTMAHVANAKTSKQAEADWILGIGKQDTTGYEYLRFLNISKNKLLGSSKTKPELRHGKFDCIIRPEIARYEDAGKKREKI